MAAARRRRWRAARIVRWPAPIATSVAAWRMRLEARFAVARRAMRKRSVRSVPTNMGARWSAACRRPHACVVMAPRTRRVRRRIHSPRCIRVASQAPAAAAIRARPLHTIPVFTPRRCAARRMRPPASVVMVVTRSSAPVTIARPRHRHACRWRLARAATPMFGSRRSTACRPPWCVTTSKAFTAFPARSATVAPPIAPAAMAFMPSCHRAIPCPRSIRRTFGQPAARVMSGPAPRSPGVAFTTRQPLRDTGWWTRCDACMWG